MPSPSPSVAGPAPGRAIGVDQWSALINLAGRQRMLSQRIVLLAVLAERGDDQARSGAAEALRQFTQAHRTLSQGGEGLPPPPTPALRQSFFGADGVDAPVRAFIALAQQVLRPGAGVAGTALASLLAQATPVLERLHGLTQRYESAARAAAAEAERQRAALVGRIEQIADEARVVSLNARIAAARAGTAGREFAVVAARLSAVSEEMALLSREAVARG